MVPPLFFGLERMDDGPLRKALAEIAAVTFGVISHEAAHLLPYPALDLLAARGREAAEPCDTPLQMAARMPWSNATACARRWSRSATPPPGIHSGAPRRASPACAIQARRAA